MDPLTSLLESLDQAASTRSPSTQDVLAHANAPSEQVAPQRTTNAPPELVVPHWETWRQKVCRKRQKWQKRSILLTSHYGTTVILSTLSKMATNQICRLSFLSLLTNPTMLWWRWWWLTYNDGDVDDGILLHQQHQCYQQQLSSATSATTSTATASSERSESDRQI